MLIDCNAQRPEQVLFSHPALLTRFGPTMLWSHHTVVPPCCGPTIGSELWLPCLVVPGEGGPAPHPSTRSCSAGIIFKGQLSSAHTGGSPSVLPTNSTVKNCGGVKDFQNTVGNIQTRQRSAIKKKDGWGQHTSPNHYQFSSCAYKCSGEEKAAGARHRRGLLGMLQGISSRGNHQCCSMQVGPCSRTGNLFPFHL